MAAEELTNAILEIAEKEALPTEELCARVECGTPGERAACVAALIEDGLLTETDGEIHRAPPNVLWARLRAMGCATTGKSGCPRRKLWADGVTDGDIAALAAVGLLTVGSGDVPADQVVKIPGGIEESIFAVGNYLVCLASLGKQTTDEVLLATMRLGDWATSVEIQEKHNEGRDPNTDGSGWLAIQQIEERLLALYDSAALDMRAADPERVWREDPARRSTRIAKVCMALLGRNAVSVGRLAAITGYPQDIIAAELIDLADASIVEHDADDPDASLDLGGDGIPTILRLGANALTVNSISAEVQETAAWRKKYEDERKRGNDLATWLRRYGIEEETALDQVRGIVRAPAPKGEPYEHTQARSVNAAEKGQILEEVLTIKDRIAELRLDRESANDGFKSRLKGYEAQIKELEDASRSNQRIVTIKAYKQTFFDEGVVRIFAEDDGRLLEEQPLPRGTQGGLFEEAPKAEPAVVTKADIAALATKLEQRGFKVSANGEPEEEDDDDNEAVDDLGSDDEDEPPPAAAASDDTDEEPGPLATEAQRRTRRSRKPKSEARATT